MSDDILFRVFCMSGSLRDWARMVKIVTTPEALFFNVARLVIDGRRGGTSFVVAPEARTRQAAPAFLVTAGHVVKTAREVVAYFLAGNPSEAALAAPVECLLPDRWYFHPDPRVDIAIFDIDEVGRDLERVDRDVYLHAIVGDDILSKWVEAPNPVFEMLRKPQSIDELIFVGFPNNYYDPGTGMPVMRRGLTATPMWLDYDGEPVFLLDAAVVEGSSGSPVFHVDWHNPDMARRSARLVGVVSEKLTPKAVGAFRTDADHIYLGRVFKAYTILEAVEAYRRDVGCK